MIPGNRSWQLPVERDSWGQVDSGKHERQPDSTAGVRVPAGEVTGIQKVDMGICNVRCQ